MVDTPPAPTTQMEQVPTPNQQLQQAIKTDLNQDNPTMDNMYRQINQMEDAGTYTEDTRKQLLSAKGMVDFANDPTVKSVAGIGLATGAVVQPDEAMASQDAPTPTQLCLSMTTSVKLH
jgi:hypothetical protein